MANQLFQVKSGDLRKLKKFYKRAPKQFGKAAGGVLNDFAFGILKAQKKTIRKRMVVRNSKFVDSSFRVKKARGSDINSLQAETGSILRKRFSGWQEQELGKRSNRTKTVSKFGRGGSEKGILKPKFRMKSSARFPRPSDFPGKTQNQRVFAMLRKMKRKSSRPFVITSSKIFHSGLYKFHNRKIMRLQKFKNRKQPKRIKWHTEAKREYFNSVVIRDIWAKNIRRTLKFRS
jgi:hypothetical protein